MHVRKSHLLFAVHPQTGETSPPGRISRGIARRTQASEDRTRPTEDRTRAHTLDTATLIISHHTMYWASVASLRHLLTLLKALIVHSWWWSWDTTSENEKKSLCRLWNWKFAVFVSSIFNLRVSSSVSSGETNVGDRSSKSLFLFFLTATSLASIWTWM